jgi:hypothetical protein
LPNIDEVEKRGQFCDEAAKVPPELGDGVIKNENKETRHRERQRRQK